MKLGDAFARYTKLTEDVSSRLRQLSFAGLAVVWLYRNTASGLGGWASITAVLLFSLGLLFDLLQPLVISIPWQRWARKSETDLFRRFKGDLKSMNEEELGAPPSIHRWGVYLFNAKIAVVCMGYVVLVGYLFSVGFVPLPE